MGLQEAVPARWQLCLVYDPSLPMPGTRPVLMPSSGIRQGMAQVEKIDGNRAVIIPKVFWEEKNCDEG